MTVRRSQVAAGGEYDIDDVAVRATASAAAVADDDHREND